MMNLVANVKSDLYVEACIGFPEIGFLVAFRIDTTSYQGILFPNDHTAPAHVAFVAFSAIITQVALRLLQDSYGNLVVSDLIWPNDGLCHELSLHVHHSYEHCNDSG